MNFVEFEKVLVETTTDRCRTLFLFWMVVLFFLLLDVVLGMGRKSNEGVSIWNLFTKKILVKNKLTLKQQIVCKLIVIILIPVIMLICYILPACNDITNQQYIEVCGQYSRNEDESEGNMFSNGRVKITTGEDVFYLELPAKWNVNEFPFGTYCGTIWYSQDSKVIMSFCRDT